MKWKVDSSGNYIYGDYVITGVKNAFNDKRSYWISKKGYLFSFYCFTYINEKDFLKMMEDPESWVKYYEEMLALR